MYRARLLRVESQVFNLKVLRGLGNIHISFIGRTIITFRGEARASEKRKQLDRGSIHTIHQASEASSSPPPPPRAKQKFSNRPGCSLGLRSRFIFTHVKHARRRRSNDRSSGVETCTARQSTSTGTGTGEEKNGRRAPGKIPGRVEARSPTQIPEEQLSQEAIGPRLNTTLAFHRQSREPGESPCGCTFKNTARDRIRDSAERRGVAQSDAF